MSWQDGKLFCTTIGGGTPISVCGSGIVDALACLFRGGLVDETGAMNEAWSETGYPLAICAALEREWGRFEDSAKRADECPFGSVAVAGSGLPLDRVVVAKALGFSRPSRYAIDATADRDACVEYAAAAPTLLMPYKSWPRGTREGKR